MLGHASAAMTLDVYADLFESDLDDVAVTVSKMCPRWAQANERSTPKMLLTCGYTVKSAVPSVRFELTLYGF